AWHGFSKCLERSRQYLCGRNRNVSDMQFAVFTASEGTHPFHGFIAALQKLADFFQKEFSLGGKGYAARAATQKIHPDLILQVLDLSAQRRLRDSKPRGGLGEVQGFTNRQKVSQVS